MNKLCPQCEGPVLDYAPGVSATEYQGELYHPACLLEGHTATVSALYAAVVKAHLTQGSTKTRPDSHPLLSDEEGEELLQNFLLGVSAKDFAAKLEARDVAAFEKVCS